MRTTLLVVVGTLMVFARGHAAPPNDDVAKVVESFYAQYYKEVLHKPSKGNPDKALIRWVQCQRESQHDAFKESPEQGRA